MKWLSSLLAALLLTGCASRPVVKVAAPPTADLFLAEATIIQRGVLTVRGRQFTLNGYVAKSDTRGLRLLMTENFGGVLADVLVKPDGEIFVMQAKAPFREAWVRNYIAADLRCIFGRNMETNCPVQMLNPRHFVIERRWYKLDLQTVEVKPGAPPDTTFDATNRMKP